MIDHQSWLAGIQITDVSQIIELRETNQNMPGSLQYRILFLFCHCTKKSVSIQYNITKLLRTSLDHCHSVKQTLQNKQAPHNIPGLLQYRIKSLFCHSVQKSGWHTLQHDRAPQNIPGIPQYRIKYCRGWDDNGKYCA